MEYDLLSSDNIELINYSDMVNTTGTLTNHTLALAPRLTDND